MTFKGTVVIKKEDQWYVATCLENDVTSQGHSIDEAMANLKEAMELWYEGEDEKEIILSLNNEQIFITSMEFAV